MEYLIIFDVPSMWKEESRRTVLLAAEIAGTALMPFTGLSAVESFNLVFGTIHVRFNSTLKFWAYTSGNVIIFRHRNFILLTLILHELGHMFGIRAKNIPTKQFVIDKISTKNGSMWGGMHPPGLDEYSEIEGFSNLFADYCLHMLSLNTYGYNLKRWLNLHMKEWCLLIYEYNNV